MPQVTANNKVLLLDTNHPVLEERLRDAGFHCDYFPDLNLDKLKQIIGFYSGVIVRSRFHLDQDILSLAGNLSFIGRVGAGVEGIDVVYAQKAGIRCFNAPEGNRNAVGEHALGMLLALMNRMIIADYEVRKGIWKREENRGMELDGKTIGIIGYGNTGGAFARKLSSFNCNVLAYDKYKSGFSDEYVKEAVMEEIFRHSDVLSLHVPQTPLTIKMINTEFINKFHKSFWLLNTARGKCIVTENLVAALKSGKIMGTGLDVLEYEKSSFENMFNDHKLPQAFQYLIQADNVLLTPHVAGWTIESKEKLAQTIVAKIKAKFC